MPSLRDALIAICVVAVSGCAGLRVNTDYDREASFTTLSTYDWLESPDHVRRDLDAISPFLARRLQRAVERELGEGGFVRQTEGEVDFLVSAFVVTTPSEDESGRVSEAGRYGRPGPLVHFSFGFGWRPDWYGYRHPYHLRAAGFPYFGYPYYSWYPFDFGIGYLWVPVVSRLDGSLPGTLVVDVLNASTGELIWRGWADRALAFAPDPEELMSLVDDAVREIMKDFPPPQRRP